MKNTTKSATITTPKKKGAINMPKSTKKNPKPLIVDESLFAYKDDVQPLFACPNEGCIGVLLFHYAYCPMCGNALEWDKNLIAKIRQGLFS